MFYTFCGLVGLILLAYVVELALSLRDDPREPSRLRSNIPLVGHVFGMIKNGPSYHSCLRNATNAEIYTLGIFNFKLYTSTSTRLLPAIQRQSNALSFRPMIQRVAQKWGDASDDTYNAFGGPHLSTDFSRAMRSSLSPGPHLDEVNRRMGNRIIIDLNSLLFPNGGTSAHGTQIKLLKWTRHVITQASSCGIYGESHPLANPETEDAFWTWHSYLSGQISGLDFDIWGIGRAAQQKIFDAHLEYCKSIPEDSSLLFKERWRVLREAGISETDCIKQQATLPIGMLSNTVPTCFWTIYELFSRHEILSDVRKELEVKAVKQGGGEFVLDVSALKTECPLLLSIFQETQRVRHIHAAIRKVLEDTLLDGKYLLKAGNYLQMPGNSIHTNTALWGESATEFDPYRFIADPNNSKGPHRYAGSAFLSWGAPPHLCPARQFAATEILILLALLVLRVDLNPVAGSWGKTPVLDYNDPVTVLNPKSDIDIKVVTRDKWVGRWTLLMSSSTIRVPLASG